MDAWTYYTFLCLFAISFAIFIEFWMTTILRFAGTRGCRSEDEYVCEQRLILWRTGSAASRRRIESKYRTLLLPYFSFPFSFPAFFSVSVTVSCLCLCGCLFLCPCFCLLSLSLSCSLSLSLPLFSVSVSYFLSLSVSLTPSCSRFPSLFLPLDLEWKNSELSLAMNDEQWINVSVEVEWLGRSFANRVDRMFNLLDVFDIGSDRNRYLPIPRFDGSICLKHSFSPTSLQFLNDALEIYSCHIKKPNSCEYLRPYERSSNLRERWIQFIWIFYSYYAIICLSRRWLLWVS